jgi:hypothetical protein
MDDITTSLWYEKIEAKLHHSKTRPKQQQANKTYQKTPYVESIPNFSGNPAKSCHDNSPNTHLEKQGDHNVPAKHSQVNIRNNPLKNYKSPV